MNRIKKGDKVRVISGSHRGEEGIILEVFPKENKAIVDKINIRKKHKKPNQQSETGSIEEIVVPLHLSKLAIIDSKGKGKTTRVRYGYDKENNKVRIAKISNTEIGKK